MPIKHARGNLEVVLLAHGKVKTTDYIYTHTQQKMVAISVQ